MISASTFYLSRVLGRKALSESGDILGKINDILVDLESGKPQIIAIKIRSHNKNRIIDFSTFSVYEEKGQYIFKCGDPEKEITDLKENTLFLKNHVLDKQLVDINGRKLVRVNDLRLAILTTGAYVVAVDVGLEGLLRRLGIAKPIKHILHPFKVTLPNKLILWDEVETVDFGSAGIKLSKTYSKLETLHVSDLADIIEDMDAQMQAEVFASLNEERAADVLEELETEAQINVLERISVEKAADVLEKMPADEVADILEEMPEERAEELLLEMESESSEEVRELMEYEDDEVGSLMSTDFISFNKALTAGETIDELRKLKPESSSIYYLYVIDEDERLIATVSLRDLIVSNPQTVLSDIMNRKILYVQDADPLDSIAEIISKYNLLAIPVVDKNMVLVGTVVIDDVVYTLLKSRRKKGL